MVSSRSLSALLALAFASLAFAQNCTLQFDGRIPKTAKLADFDAKTSIFNPDFVKGQNVTMSQALKLPTVLPSMFDITTVPIEVTLSNNSIFAPSPTNIQTAVRRLELLVASNNGSDASTVGVKTLHISFMKDSAKPLNLSHEYMLAWLEDAQFSNNMFNIRAGTMLNENNTDPNSIGVYGNSKFFKTPEPLLFITPFVDKVWHNFALTLDFNKNTTQVYYSAGNTALKNVTGVVPNELGGRGQYHFGLDKKPTDFGDKPLQTNGYQEPNIDEGILISGLFMEDSSTGCISLAPTAVKGAAASCAA